MWLGLTIIGTYCMKLNLGNIGEILSISTVGVSYQIDAVVCQLDKHSCVN